MEEEISQEGIVFFKYGALRYLLIATKLTRL